MNFSKDFFTRLIDNGTQAWTNVELNMSKKRSVLKQINDWLSTNATPEEENNVKIEIIRQSCFNIKRKYPSFSSEVDFIINQFEHNLKFDNMAILPFKQLDSLTFRIFISNNLMAGNN